MSNYAMPLAPFMSTSVESVTLADSLDTAEKRLEGRRITSLPVLDDSRRLQGMITRSDILRIGRVQAGMRQDASLLTIPSMTVEQAMTRGVVEVAPDASVAEAANLMVRHRVHRVLVVEDRRVLGIFSTRDMMRVIEKQKDRTPIHTFMSSPVFTVRSSEPIKLATDRLARARISGLVVVEDSWPVGVFTQAEALRAHDLAASTPVEEALSPRFLSLAADTPIHRAAAQAAALGARRVLAMHGPRIEGLLSGLDFARTAN